MHSRGFDPFFTEIQEVYDEIGESYDGDWPPPPPEAEPDFADEIEQSGLFEDVRVRRYVWERFYTADEYIALLETFSGHISMDAAKREHLYGEIRARLGDPPRATPLVRHPPRRAQQDVGRVDARGRSSARDGECA